MCFLWHIKYVGQFESLVPAVILSLIDGQKAKWYKSLTFRKIFLGWVLSVSKGKSKIFILTPSFLMAVASSDMFLGNWGEGEWMEREV